MRAYKHHWKNLYRPISVVAGSQVHFPGGPKRPKYPDQFRTISPLIQRLKRSLLQREKRSGREANRFSLSGPEDKNKWSYTSAPLACFQGMYTCTQIYLLCALIMKMSVALSLLALTNHLLVCYELIQYGSRCYKEACANVSRKRIYSPGAN